MELSIQNTHKNAAAWSLKAGARPLMVKSAPYPSPGKGQVVLKVAAVAINPIDWIMQDQDLFGLDYPAILGIDVAGEVVKVGEDVKNISVGDRAISWVLQQEKMQDRCSNFATSYCDSYGSKDPSHGAFQQYTIVREIVVCKIPSDMKAHEAVVLPLGITTAAAGLYQKDFLGLPLPSKDPKPLGRTVLIWGGSSSVGSCAIQLAAASGAEVITTASPSNSEYCKKLGASQVFDYHNSSVEDDIVEAVKGKTLAGAYHAVGGDGAVESCARIVDRCVGKAIVVTVRGAPDKGVPKSVRIKSSKANPRNSL